MNSAFFTDFVRLAADCRRRADAYHDQSIRRELLLMASEYEAEAVARQHSSRDDNLALPVDQTEPTLRSPDASFKEGTIEVEAAAREVGG